MQRADLSDSSALERFRINLTWLLKLRWAGVIGQLATVLTVHLGLGLKLPLAALFSIVGVTALTNGALVWWFGGRLRQATWQRWTGHAEPLIASITVLDVAQLTALLYVTGGATNPFAVFFLVHLALGGAILRGCWVWGLSGIVVLAFGLLMLDSLPLPPMPDPGEGIGLLQKGMFIAVVTAAFIIVYFVSRLQSELARLERELETARHRRAQNERLAALATLAGGAAHELSSPLSTIAVVARELERQLESGAALEDAVEDARLIRREVTRCRTILDRMSAEAGESVGEKLVWISLVEVVREGLRDIEGFERVRTDLPAAVSPPLLLPPRALGQAIRDLTRNALDATRKTGATVEVSAHRLRDELHVEIRDPGEGMTKEVLARAGEPFFTTKEPGCGMGLGLFLARAVVERLGGQLHLQSAPGHGTMARIKLPLLPPPTGPRAP